VKQNTYKNTETLEHQHK